MEAAGEGDAAVATFGILAVDNPLQIGLSTEDAWGCQASQDLLFVGTQQQILNAKRLEIVETALEEFMTQLVRIHNPPKSIH